MPFKEVPPERGVAYEGEFVDFVPPKLFEVLVLGREADGEVERVPPKAEDGFEEELEVDGD